MTTKISGEFTIDVGGDPEYKDLVAEIYYKEEFIGLISQESGYNSLNLQIHPPTVTRCWEFKLCDFEEALIAAKNRLWELRKKSSDLKAE